VEPVDPAGQPFQLLPGEFRHRGYAFQSRPYYFTPCAGYRTAIGTLLQNRPFHACRSLETGRFDVYLSGERPRLPGHTHKRGVVQRLVFRFPLPEQFLHQPKASGVFQKPVFAARGTDIDGEKTFQAGSPSMGLEKLPDLAP